MLADPAWENGIDEDGNGLSDDLVGWDFHDDDNEPWADISSHGSNKALIIGGTANNGYRGAGVNWFVRMIPVRITDGIDGTEFNTNVVAALDYSVGTAAPIIYNGWRGLPVETAAEFSQEIYDAIDRTRQADQLFVAAAGNGARDTDVQPWYPQSYDVDNVIVAAALSETGNQLALSSVTNWGATSVDIGVTSYNSVTSNALAITTGVAALIKSAHPDWTYPQIKAQILATVDPTASLAGKTVTGGRLNAANALDVAQFSITDATATEGSTSVRFVDEFVSTGSGGLNQVGSVLFGPDGNLYVASRFTNSVLRYDGSSGVFIDEVVPSSLGLNGAAYMTFGPDDCLYVSSDSNVVVRWDSQTGDVDTFIPAGTGLAAPKGVAFDASGTLYVSNSDTGEVLRFSGPAGGPNGEAPGTFLGVFVAAGGSNPLDNPSHLAFNGSHLYVANTRIDSVNRYDAITGAFVDVIVAPNSGSLDAPSNLLFRNGFLYVCSQFGDQVLRYNAATGAFVDAVFPSGAGGLDSPWGMDFDAAGNFYVGSSGTSQVLRYGVESQAAFALTLSSPSSLPVTVNYTTANGSAIAGSDYTAASGTITFAPGQTSRTILVQTLDNAVYEGNETFFVNLSSPSVGAVISDTQGVATIQDNEPLLTKFYVVDDASANRTFEYATDGTAVENYTVSSGNTTPRGAASNVAGDKVWVVDANRNVYVYSPSGTLLGSWSVGGFNNSAQFEGIATNGTDIWIVDAKSDKVYRFTGAASRINGSQSAASSFSLNSGNKDASDLVTDGTNIWVLNNTSADKVFKYTVSGAVLGNWSISTAIVSSPTGITLDPASPSHLWIVDSGTDRVYQYDTAVGRISGTQAASISFALAAGNSNPQGIADPPVGGAPASEPVEAAPTLAGVLATSAARLTPQSSIDTQDQAELYLPLAVIDTSRLFADPRWLKTAVSAAVIDAPTSSSHDEALSSIADELEGLIPVRKIKR